MASAFSAHLRALLHENGYRLDTRSGPWTECLATLAEERWIGHGPDEDAALTDLVNHMLPSAIGRRLLVEATAQRPTAPGEGGTAAAVAGGDRAAAKGAPAASPPVAAAAPRATTRTLPAAGMAASAVEARMAREHARPAARPAGEVVVEPAAPVKAEPAKAPAAHAKTTAKPAEPSPAVAKGRKESEPPAPAPPPPPAEASGAPSVEEPTPRLPEVGGPAPEARKEPPVEAGAAAVEAVEETSPPPTPPAEAPSAEVAAGEASSPAGPETVPGSSEPTAVAKPAKADKVAKAAKESAAEATSRDALVLHTAGRVAAPSVTGAGQAACAVDDEKGLFMVAGDLTSRPSDPAAARMALESLHASFEEAPSPRLRQPPLPRLVAAVQRANTRVHAAGLHDAALNGGTTLAALWVKGKRLVLAHVGDARIYRLRAGVLELLTTDHTAYNEAMKRGKRTTANGREGGLTRILGGAHSLEVDASVATPRRGDLLFLCTRGVHAGLSHEELAAGLLADGEPDGIVDRLLAAARSRKAAGGAAAIVVRLGEGA